MSVVRSKMSVVASLSNREATVIEAIVRASRYGFPQTVELLIKAIDGAGATLFANIDQSAAAKEVGLELRPTVLLAFGNPRAGTPLMDAFPLSGLDLPLKFLIWEERETVSVAYVPMKIVAGRYGVLGKDSLVAALDRTLETLIATVT
jgi:uncharacterized protein (DUF302 family)